MDMICPYGISALPARIPSSVRLTSVRSRRKDLARLSVAIAQTPAKAAKTRVLAGSLAKGLSRLVLYATPTTTTIAVTKLIPKSDSRTARLAEWSPVVTLTHSTNETFRHSNSGLGQVETEHCGSQELVYEPEVGRGDVFTD